MRNKKDAQRDIRDRKSFKDLRYIEKKKGKIKVENE